MMQNKIIYYRRDVGSCINILGTFPINLLTPGQGTNAPETWMSGDAHGARELLC